MSVGVEALFTSALGLKSPWEVVKVDLNREELRRHRLPSHVQVKKPAAESHATSCAAAICHLPRWPSISTRNGIEPLLGASRYLIQSRLNERNDMTNNYKQANEINILLNELLAILEEQKERNWSRGIKAAAQELVGVDGTVSRDGFTNARSIYNTMTAGGRGFSKYFIWRENEDERIRINAKLDNLRNKIWEIFNS